MCIRFEDRAVPANETIVYANRVVMFAKAAWGKICPGGLSRHIEGGGVGRVPRPTRRADDGPGMSRLARTETAGTLPTGTVTFVLTDVEGSTALWETAPDSAARAIERQHELVGAAVASHGGGRPEEQGEGDSLVAAFGSASDAVAAALDAQRALVAEPWPDGLALRVRMGIHTGEARLRDARNYTGVALHRCARLRDIAHGGQTILSSVTAAIVGDALPHGAWLDDLGMFQLRDLSRPERVFELRHRELAGDFPPLRSLEGLPNNLPVQLTSFVGRAGELTEVQRLLTTERLVTLTGSGGCGKTRLAVQAAAELADRWPDGVWWIDLGPVTDPALVAALTASTMRVLVEPAGGPLRALQSQLRGRRLLMCLDNCEHLLDAGAELAGVLLRTCPQVSVLATSREPLGVPGETIWRVPSLVEDEAVRLFADRAAGVVPGFTVDDDNETTVRTLCRRVDGIPLAVELAAAWVRALTPEQILAGLDDRFRLLTGGPRGVIARQQTLVASVDWSHDLLDEGDRRVFRQLAVFAGGFMLDAARAVCDPEPGAETDVLVALARLVDKSLLLADEQGGQARYRLLETMRQYAHSRLHAAGETAASRDRHLGHFLELAEAAEPGLESADQDTWLTRLETEHDNLRAALDWGLSTPDSAAGRRLAAALPRLWQLHGHPHEGVGWLQRAIASNPDDRSALQARLLVGASLVATTAGQLPLLTASAQRGLDIATAIGDDRIRGRCLGMLAYVQFFLDFAAARDLCAQARQCAEATDDTFAYELALVLEGLAWTNGDRHTEALPIYDVALERARRRSDRQLVTFALAGQAYAALLTGDVPHADELATEALRISEPLGDYFTVGSATSNLAWVKGVAGEIDAGRALMDTVAQSVEGAGADVDVPTMVVTLGKLHLWDGDLEQAANWFERGSTYAAPLVDNIIVARTLPGLAATRRRLGQLEAAREHTERAIRVARALDMPHVLAEGLDESAFLVAAQEPDRAEDLHHEALAVRLEHGLRTHYVDSLDALAGLAARAESSVEAVRLLAASGAARELMGYPRPPISRPEYDAAVAALRTALGADKFDAAWAEGRGLSLDDAVAYARRARGTRSRPTIGWASLTPTELKVVALVVEGHTNPEIGARLFMSKATVKTHLSHVYAKLGVGNRTELATVANAQQARNRAGSGDATTR
jgi:predicted ATPase/class 3 adenylate cyclase/DNA-binding CsgD family transcriptional regulator